jgi:YfiH family protein
VEFIKYLSRKKCVHCELYIDKVTMMSSDVTLLAMKNWIIPDWPVPTNIKALCTTRGLNLASHVGDDPLRVEAARAALRRDFPLPAEPCWLDQKHTRTVVLAQHYEAPPVADASYTLHRNEICAVMTGDCLPLLICDQAATVVAAVHAGWRGLAAGIIENTLESLGVEPEKLLIWLGPAISQPSYEIGPEVYAAFVEQAPEDQAAFIPSAKQGHYYADLYQLARYRCYRVGVQAGQIYGGNFCTYREADRFYSARREGNAGRLTSLIWMS